MTFSENEIDALLSHFPGPLAIGVSITRYLFALACAGVFITAGAWFIHSAEAIARTLALRHAPFSEAFLYLLISLRVARDAPQGVAELGWVALVFGGVGALAVATALISSTAGLSGLTFDKDGFTVKPLRRNIRHDWADVGDFDILIVPKTLRRWPLARRCVMFNNYRAPETPIKWLRRTGRNRVLVASYEYPADVLAPAMSIWRERALRDRVSRAP